MATITAIYKNISGLWVEQTDLSFTFDKNINYVRGDS